MDVSELIRTVAIYALPVVFAITVHEAAHGYAARYFGDPTAWQLGRVTLNPFSHIDPLGTLVMPLLLYFATSGGFVFGYAKPVPVNFGQLRRPKQHMVWVALAGPGVNFVQAVFWGVALVVLGAAGVSEPFFIEMCKAGVLVNLVKHSAIVSVIAVFDLTTQARTIISDTFMAFEIWLTTAALYLCITLSLSLAVSALERRVRRRRW